MDDLTMAHRYIIMALATIISTMGFFLKRVINKVDKLETGLAEHKVNDVEKFATKEDVRLMGEDFKGFLESLLTPVNRKLESIEVSLRAEKK